MIQFLCLRLQHCIHTLTRARRVYVRVVDIKKTNFQVSIDRDSLFGDCIKMPAKMYSRVRRTYCAIQ